MSTRTKTKITPNILLRVEELASKGFNNILISQSLDIGVTTLSTNVELKKSIQAGKLKLSEEITQSVLDTIQEDGATRQLLIKRLGLFNQIIDIKKPRNSKDALENLAKSIKLYADGKISESQLRAIEATANSYIKCTDTTELEARLTALEEAHNG